MDPAASGSAPPVRRDALLRAEPWLWAAAFAAILVPLVLGLATNELPKVNSDVAVPWIMVGDVLAHGTDVAWTVGGPVYVVPELPLLAVSRAVTHELGPGYTLYAGLQFALLAAGAALLVRACSVARDGFGPAIGLAVCAAYLAVTLCSGVSDRSACVFFPALHQGMVAVGMLYLGLLAEVLRAGGGRVRLALLGAVAAAAALSDALALHQFLVPGMFAAAVLARGRAERSCRIAIVAWTAGGIAAGLAAYAVLDVTPFWSVLKLAAAPFPHRDPESLRLAARDLPSQFGPSDWATAAATVVFLALASRRALREASSPVAGVLLRTLGVAAIVTVSVPPLAGRWHAHDAVRYMLWLWVLAPAAAAVAVAGASAGRGLRRAFLATALAGAGWAAAAHGAATVPPTPYPLFVRAMDEVAAAPGMDRALATYGYSGLVNALTRRGVRAAGIREYGAAELWMTNADWFFDGAPEAPRWPEYRVVVTGDTHREVLRQRLGEPAAVIPLGGLRDQRGELVELWLRPPPGPPFWTGPLREGVLGQTTRLGLRSIDPRARGERR